MALGHNLDYISLKNIRLELEIEGQNSTVITDLTELQIPRTIEFAERKPGMSDVMVKVVKHHDCVMKAKGFSGDILAFKDVIPGARIASATMNTTEAAPVSILQSDFLTKFPVSGWMMGNAATTLTDEPSSWEFDIHTNIRG